MIQMGPMLVQSMGPCTVCMGAGRQKGDSCEDCKGSGFQHQEKNLNLVIQAGMREGERIVFPGESSHHEQFSEPGDVVMELQSAEEECIWEREGNDLVTSYVIGLGSALCGTQICLPDHPAHEEGLHIHIPAGVQNQTEVILEGLGMPMKGGGFGNARIGITITPSPEEEAILAGSELRRVFGVPPIVPVENVKVFEAKRTH